MKKDNITIIIIIVVICSCLLLSISGGFGFYSQTQTDNTTTTTTPIPQGNVLQYTEKPILKSGCKNNPKTNHCESSWKCTLNGVDKGSTTIWWGHTEGDAGWACNNWNANCQGNCKATII